MSWRDVGLGRLATDWARDPVRRKHVVARIVETAVPASLVLGLVWAVPEILWFGGWKTFAGLVALLVVLEFLLYEFLLEPYWWAGPWWERGPRDGETFRRW